MGYKKYSYQEIQKNMKKKTNPSKNNKSKFILKRSSRLKRLYFLKNEKSRINSSLDGRYWN